MERVKHMLVEPKRLQLPDEKLRLEIKKIADSIRLKWAYKGLTDIFMILENFTFLIRKPLKTKEISAFTTYINEIFIVFLNSSFSLGHERFSAAHELYHIECNADVLKKEKLHVDGLVDLDDRANIFAAEFLMPEDIVRDIFYKLVNIKPDEIETRHIVRLNSYFMVSYAAMLKRLIQLNLCDKGKYSELRSYGAIEKADELIEITRKEGYEATLLLPSNITRISKEYIEIAKTNFEKSKISYGKLEELLSFIGETPENYGYEKPREEDCF